MYHIGLVFVNWSDSFVWFHALLYSIPLFHSMIEDSDGGTGASVALFVVNLCMTWP